MNKRLLIISPYFAPVNAADMQRVRISLPYYPENGWDTELVMVDENYADMPKDSQLLKSIPAGYKIHKVRAFDKKWTAKAGLGSIALRSLFFYKLKVDELLSKKKYDLIFFTTTQFPVCILGSYWKKKHGVPYVIDIQDPWHSEYYQNKPKAQRPPKYWFSYRLNKYLEPIALKNTDGLISVSSDYISALKKRYSALENVPNAVIPFGASWRDMQIAEQRPNSPEALLSPDHVNIVYVGRGGADMHQAIRPVFAALKKGLDEAPELFKRLNVYFIGTSYAPAGEGIPTILPLAKEMGVENHVAEITDRIGYYQTLQTLLKADALFIPGSDDPAYSASKLYPYLMTQKPLLAIFNKASNVMPFLNKCAQNALVYSFGDEEIRLVSLIYHSLTGWAKREYQPVKLSKAFEKYSAGNLAAAQADLFNRAVNHFKTQP